MLSPEQKAQFYKDGYLVLPSFFSSDKAQQLLAEARKLLSEVDLSSHPKTRFSTGDSQVSDDFFLTSGDKIRAFFEEDAFDPNGQLNRPKEQAINKIGHALHELNPIYRQFTLENNDLKTLAKELDYHKDPAVLQSMVICKQPSSNTNQVPTHDDSTFLYTDPPSALGFWFALEQCTKSNGCLSFARGSHKRNTISKRFVRLPQGGTGFEKLGSDAAGIDWEKEGDWVVEECEPGALVLIDGAVIHRSEKNLSDKSRFIYTCQYV